MASSMKMKTGGQLDANHSKWCGPLGEWASEADKARCFATSADAIKFAIQHELPPFRVIHVFSQEQYNFTSGLLDFSRRSSQCP